MLYHFECNVKLAKKECVTDGISMQTKFVHVEMKMKFCLEKSTFSFGFSQKVNNSAPQPEMIFEFQ